MEELRDLCVMLNLERSGEKKALADRIATFLYKPMDLGESKPSPKRTPQKRKASPKGKKAKVAKTASGEDEETASDEEEAMLEDLKSQEGSAMEE